MVSVFEGQLTRTWNYLVETIPASSSSSSSSSSKVITINEGEKVFRKHVITLYHDTITGVRSAMLDYEEIPGSMVNNNYLNIYINKILNINYISF
jgi:hypothetical protein